MSENKKLKLSAKARVKPVEGEPLKVEFAPGCFDHIDVRLRIAVLARRSAVRLRLLVLANRVHVPIEELEIRLTHDDYLGPDEPRIGLR